MIVYLGHNYSLMDCMLIRVRNVEYVMSFDKNNFCKDHRIKVRFKVKEYVENEM